jgi:hypothetical protein
MMMKTSAAQHPLACVTLLVAVAFTIAYALLSVAAAGL